jgi:hypothetical protein
MPNTNRNALITTVTMSVCTLVGFGVQQWLIEKYGQSLKVRSPAITPDGLMFSVAPTRIAGRGKAGSARA